MKKFLGIVLATLCICTTGCGSSKGNTITCTKTEDSEKSTMTATVSGDKVTKIEMKTISTLENEDEVDTSYGFMQLAVGMLSAYDGIDAKLDKKDLTITMTVNMDFAKMSDEAKEEMGFDDSELTAEAFKKSAEEEGATCK